MTLDEDGDLRAVLAIAQVRGFIGPGDLEPHIEHALSFVRALGPLAPTRVLDLGSGGGLPGLVLAGAWPQSHWVLLDANEQRTAFLREAVTQLGAGDRVQVLRGRAEELAHDELWRRGFDLVVVRAFGPPAVVAECAAGFLAAGGRLAVSEPPGSDAARWDAPDALATLGLAVVDSPTEQANIQVLQQVTLCPDRYPRRVGIPAKRPLF